MKETKTTAEWIQWVSKEVHPSKTVIHVSYFHLNGEISTKIHAQRAIVTKLLRSFEIMLEEVENTEDLVLHALLHSNRWLVHEYVLECMDECTLEQFLQDVSSEGSSELCPQVAKIRSAALGIRKACMRSLGMNEAFAFRTQESRRRQHFMQCNSQSQYPFTNDHIYAEGMEKTLNAVTSLCLCKQELEELAETITILKGGPSSSHRDPVFRWYHQPRTMHIYKSV